MTKFIAFFLLLSSLFQNPGGGYNSWGKPVLNGNLVADGDSITFGQGATNPYTALMGLSGNSWTITNKGIPGELLSTMLTNAPTAIDPLFTSKFSKNVVVIWGGTNDIANSQQPVDVYANLTSYIAARHAVGWKVIAVTMLSRVGWDAKKDQYNALILANTAKADGIADFSGTPLGVDNGYLNATWFQADEIHPTTLGVVTYEAPIISTAVNALP